MVDDGAERVQDLVRPVANTRYVHLGAHVSIGTKRNRACQMARGEIIAHWDDDDWSEVSRLERQAAPLVERAADITGMENRFVLNLNDGAFWTTTEALHRRMFVGNVHGGTLMYWKQIWQDGVHYPEINLAEDARWLECAVQRGKRLVRVENPGVYVYVRHGKNAWRFETGTFLDAHGWKRIENPSAFSPGMLEAYSNAARVPQFVRR